MKRTAIITGAAGGIGKALCKVFSGKDYRVLAIDRRAGEELECDHFLNYDITDVCQSHERLKALADRIRDWLDGAGLNVLVNNAAVQKLAPTEEITLDDWHLSLDTNLTAPLFLTQALLDDLDRGSGSVINMGSVHAVVTKPGFVTYATSKAAIVGLTRAMAVDLGERVRINAINPAATETPMLLESFGGNPERYEELRQMHPMKRIAQPEEIAEVAVFLASEQASFITGAALTVDGGILSRLRDPV